MKEIKKGIYRHFKGNYYEVIGFATHSENQESLVVYKALYGDHRIWVRPVSMWNETVVRDGEEKRRFEYIGAYPEAPTPTSSLGKNKILRKMKDLEKIIGYTFVKRRWLAEAMNMKIVSPPEDHTPEYANERLAIVGDSILKTVLTEKMYIENPEYSKSQITDVKKDLENNKVMKRVVDKYKIYKYSFNDRYFYTSAPAGAKIPNPTHTPFIESIIGAVFLDSGNYVKTRKWILDWLLPELEEAAGKTNGM